MDGQQICTENDNQQQQSDITFYNDLASAKTVDALKQQVVITLEKLGFSDFFFCIPGVKVTGFITTLPKEIYLNFLVGKHSKSNLLIDHCRKSTSPVFLSSIVSFVRSSPIDTEIFQRFDEFYKAMECYDFFDCYAIPNRYQIGNINALLLVADSGTPIEEFRYKIKHCSVILNLFSDAMANIGSTGIFPSLFLPSLNSIKITPKILELLNVLAKENLTLKKAAERLEISLDALNKRIAAAKKALGTSTLPTTIYRAVMLGFIHDE